MAGRSGEPRIADYNGDVQYVYVSDVVLASNSDCEVW